MVARRDTLSAADLPDLLRHLDAAMAAARVEVDALNVFPVPDGDTGTNLARTVSAALQAVDLLGEDASGPELARAAGRGAVRGAAGNSGVIFSQVLRAVTEHLADGPLDVPALPRVLRRAHDLSCEALADPVGGTILTAMDAAAEAARDSADAGADLVKVLDQVVTATARAVDATRYVLEANRLAGVVDAGARGLEVALDAVRGFLAGEAPADVEPAPIRRARPGPVHRESGSVEYAYEVQYLLEAPDEVAAEVRSDLQGLGDSVVVVACGGLLNVHVHTNATDQSVEVGERRGLVSRVQVTAFADQGVVVDPPPAADAVGYLTVMPGGGLRSLCRALGAGVLHGEAGSLPTVADVLDGVGRVHAEEVVLLPGHPAVAATMRRASEVSAAEGGRRLHVVDAATSVPAALAALAVARRDEVDLDGLGASAVAVRSAEVVAAVRDAVTPVGEVARGQPLVVADGEVIAQGGDPVDALGTALRWLGAAVAELVTLVGGGQVGDGERRAALALAADLAPDAEVEFVDGQQASPRWIVGVE